MNICKCIRTPLSASFRTLDLFCQHTGTAAPDLRHGASRRRECFRKGVRKGVRKHVHKGVRKGVRKSVCWRTSSGFMYLSIYVHKMYIFFNISIGLPVEYILISLGDVVTALSLGTPKVQNLMKGPSIDQRV